MFNSKSLLSSTLLLLSLFTLSLAINFPQNYTLVGADWTGVCAEGREQTPINIQTEKVVCDDTYGLIFDYHDENITTNFTYVGNLAFANRAFPTNDTNFIKQTYQLHGNFETLYSDDFDYSNLTYPFKQLHFHSPSQHTIDGQRFDLELHLIHMMDDADAERLNITRPVMAIAVMFTVDDDAEENPFIKAIDFENVGENVTINFKELLLPQLGESPAFYGYKGSLKMPPCYEMAYYYVIKRPLKIKSAQLEPIIAMLAGNGDASRAQNPNRLLQPLNDRIVKLGNFNCNCPWY